MNENKFMIVIQTPTPPACTFPSFLSLLLDETLISGTAYIPYVCIQKIGTKNRRLPAKQIYEWLLRLAQQFPICLTNEAPSNTETYLVLPIPEIVSDEESLKTDCYILARHKKLLLEHQFFNEAVNSILILAGQLACQTRIIPFLEDMLQEQGLYPYFFQGSQPFLLYAGDDACFHILDTFAHSLGTALQKMGYLVEYFDLSKEHFTAASRYIGQSFQAVIGMQTYMFSACLESGELLHDKIYGPKYNFVFDHPIWFQTHLVKAPVSLTILTLDRHYEAFMQHYYSLNTYFLPPGGINKAFVQQKRCYDVTFIGKYINNAAETAAQLKLLSRPKRLLVNRLWLNMRKHPTSPAETSLKLALKHYGQSVTDEEFLELFYDMRKFILYLSHHFRYKIISTLICGGIQVDVFGNSWAHCPLLGHPNLIWHKPDLSTDECLNIWQQSKIALNIMSGHKDAFTERIANSMLQKAVVLTERNPYLAKEFEDGIDLVFYDLAQIDLLPKQVKSLLASPKQLTLIGENGYQKALHSHTWEHRAKKLLELNEELPNYL